MNRQEIKEFLNKHSEETKNKISKMKLKKGIGHKKKGVMIYQ
jgi:hypothetical protein